jgi:hypothetical protein
VVHVPVDDQHPLAADALGVPRGDDGVVHQAETHPLGRQRVVARRAHGRECVASAGVRVVHRGQHRAGGAEGGVPARLVENGIEEQDAASPCAHALQAAQVAIGMHREQRILRRGRRLHHGHRG